MADLTSPPPPPPGFTPIQQPPPPPDGFSAVPPPPPGLTPVQQQPQSLLDRGVSAIANLPGIQEASGFVKGAEKTAAGAIDLANKYIIAPNDPGATDTTRKTSATAQAASDWLRKNTETHGWEKVGDIGESIAELMSPSALAEAGKIPEAMSFADHLAEAAKNAKILENNPVIARLVRVGSQALKTGLRAGAEQGTQALVKSGGDTDAAIQAGTVGAATGGVLGGAGGVVSEAVAGAAKAKAAITAAEGAPEQFATSATNTLKRAFQRLGVADEPMPVSDYGQAADQLGEHASAIYDEADRVTDGKWRDLNADYQAAKATGNKTAIAAAKQNLDDLATGSGDANFDQGVRDATDRARDAFHDHYALDTIHNSLVKAFDFGTPETAAMKGSANTFSGKELSKQLTNLERDPDVGRDRMVELMGNDGYKALHNLSDIAANPAQRQNAGAILKEIATKAHEKGSKVAWGSGMLGMFLPSGWGKAAGAGYAAGSLLGGGEVATDKLLTYIAQSPRLTNLLTYAAKNGITPRYGSAILGTAINQELEKDAAQQPQEQK